MRRHRPRMKIVRPNRGAGLTSHAPSRRQCRRIPPQNPAWWASRQPTGTHRPRPASRWTGAMCHRRPCRLRRSHAHTRPRAIVLRRRGSSRRGSVRLIADAQAWARFLKPPFIASARRRRQRLPPNKREFAHAVPVVSESRLTNLPDRSKINSHNRPLRRRPIEPKSATLNSAPLNFLLHFAKHKLL